MIIDAHAHLIRSFTGSVGNGESYDLRNGEIQFLDGSISRIIPNELYCDGGFPVETLIGEMDRAGIQKALLIQAYYYGINNRYIAQSAAKYPDRLLGVGSFDPYVDKREEIMEQLIHGFGFHVFKFEISQACGLTGFHPDFAVDGAIMEPIYRKAEQEKVKIVFDLGKRGTLGFQIDGVVCAAREHPAVSFVVCHLLAPDKEEDRAVWSRNMEKLAACENIFFDISALPWNIQERYPYRTCADFARAACDLAGSERLLWGSDVPCVLTRASYRSQYEFLRDSGRFTERELQNILCDTAEKLYWN